MSFATVPDVGVTVPDAGAGLAVAVVAVAAVVVAVAVATSGLACSSQWKGSKLVFGSTHDGFFEA